MVTVPTMVDEAQNMSESALHWIALGRIQGLGARGVHSLVRRFGSPEAVFSASLTELESCGLPPGVVRSVHAQQELAEAEQEVRKAEKLGCQVIPFSSQAYPALLKQISDPPAALYVQGDVTALSRHTLAIVGTRRPSAYGSSVAHRLAADLAQRQLVVASGMARGIDSAAHRGALEAGGKTVAVLGSGIDVVYPRENKTLASRIVQNGAVISEFPLGTHPAPENFPIRNRIISGLAWGVVIVEAAEYSGSLITARLALEQNREVFAVPGNITSPQSFGPNLLIKQGAKLVDQWMDVMEELPAAVRAELIPAVPAATLAGADGARTGAAPSLDADQKAVYDTLRADETLYIDAICGAATLPQPRVLAALLGLEMNGLVKQLPGMNFVRRL